MLVAIFSGSDWSDAAVDHLVFPANTTIEHVNILRDKYTLWWGGACRGPDAGQTYLTFVQWLVKNGVAHPARDEVLVVDQT